MMRRDDDNAPLSDYDEEIDDDPDLGDPFEEDEPDDPDADWGSPYRGIEEARKRHLQGNDDDDFDEDEDDRK